MQNEKVGENLGTDPKTGKPVWKFGPMAQIADDEEKSLLV
jgi:topoisomerase IA-like protein